MNAPPTSAAAPAPGFAATLALLWLAGLCLRPTVFVAPALARDVARALDLGSAAVGALTTLPVLAVALGAVPAARVIRRAGPRTTLVGGLALAALASAARGAAPSGAALLVATALMGLGLAALQTALPVLVARWTPHRLALGTAVYMNAMMVGEFAGAGLSLPVVLPLAGGDWRMAFVLWSVPLAGVAALLWWTPRASVRGAVEVAEPSDAAGTSGLREGRTWALGALLAGSVVVFFAINAYMGPVLAARGEVGLLATLLALYNLSPFAASLALMATGERMIGRRGPLVATAAIGAAGLVAFVVLPGTAGAAGAVVAGFASTAELICLMSLPPLLARDERVGGLAAEMTAIGYGIAFALPLVGGALADGLDARQWVFVPAIAFAAGCVALAIRTPLEARRP